MFARAGRRVLHALRWLVAAALAASLTGGMLVWFAATGARDVLDSRDFWVTWVRTSGVADTLRNHAHGAISLLQTPALEVLASRSPASAAAVQQALNMVQARVDRALTDHLGENVDAVVGYLTARDDAGLDLHLNFEGAFVGVADDVARAVHRQICPAIAEATPTAVAGIIAHTCDETAAMEAHSCATRLATWLSSSDVSRHLTTATLEALTGVHHMRMTARAVRGGVHVLGGALAAMFVVFCVFASRLRTFATLVGLALIGAAILTTPFVTFFTWLAPRLFGPEAGQIATSAAGLRPFGTALPVALGLLGAAILALRVLAPRQRARFWDARLEHADPWVRGTAQRLRATPAGFLEPIQLCRVLVRRVPPGPATGSIPSGGA